MAGGVEQHRVQCAIERPAKPHLEQGQDDHTNQRIEMQDGEPCLFLSLFHYASAAPITRMEVKMHGMPKATKTTAQSSLSISNLLEGIILACGVNNKRATLNQ